MNRHVDYVSIRCATVQRTASHGDIGVVFTDWLETTDEIR